MSDIGPIVRALAGLDEAAEVGVPGLSSLRDSNLDQAQINEIAGLIEAARGVVHGEKEAMIIGLARRSLPAKLQFLSGQLRDGATPEVVAAVLDMTAEEVSGDETGTPDEGDGGRRPGRHRRVDPGGHGQGPVV